MGSPESRVRELAIAALFEKAFAALPPIPVITPGSTSTSAEKTSPPAAEVETAPAAPPKAAGPPVITPVPDENPPAVRFIMPGRKS
jgi:hypothetical protein